MRTQSCRWLTVPGGRRILSRCRGMMCQFLLAGPALAATLASSALAFHTAPPAKSKFNTSAPLSAIVAFVETHGSPTNLGYVCKAFSLSDDDDNCRFQQLAIHSKSAELDDHGFGIYHGKSQLSRILLFHVTPLVGEFFLASRDGKLIAAATRARGTDFQPMQRETGVAAFKAELSFWQNNLAQIEHDVEGDTDFAPFPEQRQ